MPVLLTVRSTDQRHPLGIYDCVPSGITPDELSGSLLSNRCPVIRVSEAHSREKVPRHYCQETELAASCCSEKHGSTIPWIPVESY